MAGRSPRWSPFLFALTDAYPTTPTHTAAQGEDWGNERAIDVAPVFCHRVGDDRRLPESRALPGAPWLG
jgi:hypothetical protein